MHPAGGAFALLAGAENILLPALLLICIAFRRPWHTVDGSLVASLLAYCAVLLLVIGYTTPVMGAIVRYRTPLLPFVLIAALLVIDQQRILARWPRLKPLFHA